MNSGNCRNVIDENSNGEWNVNAGVDPRQTWIQINLTDSVYISRIIVTNGESSNGSSNFSHDLCFDGLIILLLCDGRHVLFWYFYFGNNQVVIKLFIGKFIHSCFSGLIDLSR